jgi:hypothetical protein
MLLEARAANCFSTSFVLKLEGRPVGKFEGRWFSEGLDVSLLERHQLQFQKVSWLGSQFVLKEMPDQLEVGRANRGGIFTSSWDLEVSTGPGRLEKEGWFGTAYVFRQEGAQARVDRLGMCERGWAVEGGGELKPADLLLLGLVFHVIQQRAAQHAAAAGHAGS